MSKWSNTMSVIEDLFDKFDKGEVRLAERTVTGSENSLDTNGEIAVTIDDLVDVESVVAVLVADGSGGYTPVDTAGGTNDIASGEGYIDASNLDISSLEDNQVGIQFYTVTGPLSDAGEVNPPDFKVIARGY